MRRLRRARAIHLADVELNMTPMIDVVFQLLIFFMVATTLSDIETDAAVVLPAAEAARDDLRSPGTVIVNVRSNGAVKVGDNVYGARELPRVFRQIAETGASRVVVVRCDESAAHQYFVQALEACAQAGLLNVRVAAKRLKEDKARR
jgi:biopolymer transport protein ExbD